MEVKKAKRNALFAKITTWIFIALLLAGFLGLIVTVIIAETGKDEATRLICYYVCFGCMGLVLLSIAGGVFAFKWGERARLFELDARERAVSDESFFIGEKTMLTFREKDVLLHADESVKMKDIVVPYSEISFYSIRMRRSPKRKGERSVLLELPAKYLNKKAEKDAKPTLIAMEYKERLLGCIQKFSATLTEASDESELPKPQRRFTIKIKQDNTKKYITLFVAIAFLVGGILLSIFLSELATVGYVLAAVGLFTLGRAVVQLVRGGTGFAVFTDGVLWMEQNRLDNLYLRWSEIKCYTRIEHQKQQFVRFDVEYGEYYFPDLNGLYRILSEQFPEKRMLHGKKK